MPLRWIGFYFLLASFGNLAIANPSVCSETNETEFTRLVCTRSSGFQYEEARKFSEAGEVDQNRSFLHKVLGSSLDTAAWENATILLGVIGKGPNDVGLLADLALSSYGGEPNPVPVEVYRAKRESFRSLGIMYSSSPDENARKAIKDFLKRPFLDPGSWVGSIKWTSPFHEIETLDLVSALLGSALEGAGLTGDAELRTLLYSFRDGHHCSLLRNPTRIVFVPPYLVNGPSSGGVSAETMMVMTRDEFDRLARLADQAAGASEFIERDGLEAYYQFRLAHAPPPASQLPGPCSLQPAQGPHQKKQN